MSRSIGRVFDRVSGQHSSLQRAVMEAGETRLDLLRSVCFAHRSFLSRYRKTEMLGIAQTI